MRPDRIVIVGGGPAALATARSYRDRGGSGELTIVGEEPRLPYERPPLTKGFLRGEVEAGDLGIESADWFRDCRVEVRTGVAVSEIEPSERRVTVSDGSELAAEVIVIATGSEPTRPSLPGFDHPLVIAIRRVPDSVRVRELSESGAATVIGGGFIASEAAASLALRGVAVTTIDREALPQSGRIGEQAASRLAGWLDDLGVRRIASATVSSIEDGRRVRLEDGRTVEGAYTVLATGVKPRSELAERAGLPTHEGRIVVDDGMRVAAGGGRVFAVGDVALAENETAGRALRVEHWGDALGHGKVAGHVLAGEDAHWGAVPGFWSTIGERTVKYAGWGDGYDEARFRGDGDDGAFTVWYLRDGATVGVLTHEHDSDYKRGRELVAAGEPPPS
jgi:3-phenylpropionate/trans-cinnamate dioxygenase ferredoxin reductase subunit